MPELNSEIQAVRGFNLIATANNRDKGVNDLSSALKRRFNTVILPLPATLDEETDIVRSRVESYQNTHETARGKTGAGRNPPHRHHLPRTTRRPHR